MALKATVHIETALRAEKTILKASFAGAPFKIADITENKRGSELRLMLMSSSPGVLDEDEYRLHLHLAERTSVALQTQSYQRIFQMKKGAVQNMNVRLQQGASLVYLPHPSVPHKGSIFTARNKIYLGDDCTLAWGEVISCGRKLNEEVFAFTSYHSLTEIYANGKMAVKENLFMQPDGCTLGGIGQMEGYTHGATFIYINEKLVADELANAFVESLAAEANVAFGVSRLPVNGVVVRLLGRKAEQLFALNKQLYAIGETVCRTAIQKTTAYV